MIIYCRYGEAGSDVHVDKNVDLYTIFVKSTLVLKRRYDGVTLQTHNINYLLKALRTLRKCGYVVPGVIERRLRDEHPRGPRFLLYVLINYVKVVFKI
jgi:hypothetical protein